MESNAEGRGGPARARPMEAVGAARNRAQAKRRKARTSWVSRSRAAKPEICRSTACIGDGIRVKFQEEAAANAGRALTGAPSAATRGRACDPRVALVRAAWALRILRRAHERAGHGTLPPTPRRCMAAAASAPQSESIAVVCGEDTPFRETLSASKTDDSSSLAGGALCGPLTQGGSPVREIRSPGSVRGAARKGRPYRDQPCHLPLEFLLRREGWISPCPRRGASPRRRYLGRASRRCIRRRPPDRE